ncbi:hypothetical protein ACBR40_34535 [Nonomuraea sp. AD125B]|uniref:hypothetical protein n=1 Tax=Nonomuraea sp. AD125B TaxID=3242897 RepID=UPI0035275697
MVAALTLNLMRVVTVVLLTPAFEVADAHHAPPGEGGYAEAEEQGRQREGVLISTCGADQQEEEEEGTGSSAGDQP